MLDMCKKLAMEAAGLGAASVMKQAPSIVMPSEEITEGVARLLKDHGFDESLVRQTQRNEIEGN